MGLNLMVRLTLHVIYLLIILLVSQHGFVKGKSKSTAIAAFINEISELLNKGDKQVGALYEFSKAFDISDHNVLL